MKKLLKAIGLYIFTINSIFAQTNKCVISYREAVALYENKDYGKALKVADDAIVQRKTQIQNEVSLVENSLASKDVKKAGDKIDSIVSVLEERGETDCIKIINNYLKKKGSAYFENSITKMLSFIKQQEQYPEAQKLIGDIYKLEGEYSFAEEYYLKALDNADVLDIPDEKYEILYELADLSRLEDDYDKMEIRLLNVIGQKMNKQNISLSQAMRNTVSKNNKEAIDKLFTLYRAYDYYSLNAYCQLSDYYVSINEIEKAFTYSSLAVITGYSKISSIIEKRDLNFEYTDFASFLDELEYHEDILEWGRKNNIWKSLNLFCDISARLGYTEFSRELLKILAFHSPEKYWQQDAVLKLDTLDGIKNPD